MSGHGLYTILVESAARAGFALSGGVDIAPAAELMAGHVERYDRWLGQGFAGAMEYLARGRDRRADPQIVFPGARSVFCVAATYDPRALGGTVPSSAPSGGPRYARYLRTRDYHRELAERLEGALSATASLWAEQRQPAFRWKICVDTSAVLERSWAALAGLGWIGKNTLLIHPKLGSYFFVAEALLDVELGRGPTPLPDFCGHCDRCQTACPTGAFPEPRTLDSLRCISYLTLEKRGPLAVDAETRRQMGTWVAGCDVCQEVCPFNRKAVSRAESGPPAVNAGYTQSWLELIEESGPEYAIKVRESALKRVKPAQFSRNLAIAFANAFQAMTLSERAALAQEASAAIRRRVSLEDADTAPLWHECLALVERAQSAKRNP